MCIGKSAAIRLWHRLVTLSSLVIASILCSSQGRAATAASTAEIRWFRLLQYEKNWLGAVKSRVDDPRFFFSAIGKSDPDAELRASLAAFIATPQSQCAFPARARFMREELGHSLPSVSCTELRDWQRGLNAVRAVLVFSTSYAGNAASMFGHTFLRLDPPERTHTLLSYGVGFAAVTTADDGSITYALRGLFGGYPGVYGIAPYYMTVNEYNNQEARDLWEYELDLSAAEINRLTEVLWELYGNAYLDYFFLDENCSFQLAALIEAVKPEWELTAGFGPIVLPRDLIQQLQHYPGALGQVTQRSSLRKTWVSRFDALSAAQKDELAALAGAAPTASAPVLAAYIAKLDFKRQRSHTAFTSTQKQQLFAALGQIARKDMSVEKTTPLPESANRPDRGHAPRLVSLGTAGTVGIRAGYHDLLDQPEGYEPYFGIRYLDLRLRRVQKQERARLELDDATLFALVSLDPYTAADPRLSWHTSLSYAAQRSEPCGAGHAAVGTGGGGLAAELWHGTITYGTVDLETRWHPDCANAAAYGPGLRWGIVAGGPGPLRHHLVYRLVRDLAPASSEPLRTQLETSHSLALSSTWAIIAKAQVIGQGTAMTAARSEWDLELRHYF